MSLPDHLRVINASPPAAVAFPQFSRLPPELRLAIWELAITSQRFLDISITYVPAWKKIEKPPEHTKYSPTNACREMLSGGSYAIEIEHGELYNNVLHVNSEARHVGLKFYRVHLPCVFAVHGAKFGQYGVLYLNPEHDLVRVSSPGTYDAVVVFLDDVKTHDPNGTGLLRLALTAYAMDCLERRLPSSVVESGAVTLRANSLAASLARLQEVVFLAQSPTGRAIFGPLQGFQRLEDPPDSPPGVRFNHAMPLMPSLGVVRFDLMPDPRPLTPDELRYVLTTSSDPRKMRLQWRRMVDRWTRWWPHVSEANRGSPQRERVLFAYWRSNHRLVTLETATSFLLGEKYSWQYMQERWRTTVIKFAGKEPPVETAEDLAHATRPAVGFWLFDADALGSLHGVVRCGVFDMREHWPELALVRLG